MKAPLPENEALRLAALREYRILDTAAERAFDDLAALASYICDVPMATISLVDAHRQWFKSRIGVDAQETSRDVAFCAHTILSAAPLIVPDATKDQRFADSELVLQEPRIRFYAGFPLTTPEGYGLGALCAIDRQPRELTPAQAEAMAALSRQVMALLEFRRVTAQLASALETVRKLGELLPICSWCKRIRDDQGYWNQLEQFLTTNNGIVFTHGVCPECFQKMVQTA